MSGKPKLINAPTASACAALLASLVAIASPSYAETVFDGSKARLNLSGKLRYLTQEVVSAGCRMTAQIDTANAQEELRVSVDKFETILNGLEKGSLTLGIPSEEKNRRPLRAITNLREKWAPVRTASDNILAGNGTPADLAAMAGANADLLEATIVLATEISGQYSNPQELLQSDAMSIGIAGRQSMFAHQIAASVCGLSAQVANLGNKAELAETIEVFQRSLIALRDGLPDAGINPPPNEAILKELTQVIDYWEGHQAKLLGLTASDGVSAENVAEAADVADELTDDMLNVVTLYMLSTPGQEDVYRVPLAAYAENELKQWLTNKELVDAIKAQNLEHANLTQEQVDALDLQWRAERKNGGGELITKLLERPSSEWLRQQSDATAGFVTEVFVMDNKGLNVAQSVETSDYWQGDEAKWQETYGNGSGNMHISEIEFDESTGFYQSQASLPIFDPETGSMIGAITFGINVQSLL
ncbi:MAG: type IV pili methyl-accepting chemotaxis transducer N-terminal domain-containing protein [Rhodobacteraceae bacterium]|nr:type IV pili methyl-accepting chemotaxis transducer N-terminal domain-containing protein [Paracoccaceae bacterium]